MAGGPSTPQLVCAVSDAGGLGFLAAGYRTAEHMSAEIREVRKQTVAPFGVNVFVPVDTASAVAGVQEDVDRYAAELAQEASRYATELGRPVTDDDDWDAKLSVLLRDPVPLVSFTFGCPAVEVVSALHDAGSAVAVTVTRPAEAALATEAGADALVAQGVEAGGHYGSFSDRDDEQRCDLLRLLPLLRQHSPLPLIAAGGIGHRGGVAAVLAAGACAAQAGTAFLRCPEAGTSSVHRQALTQARSTVVTRAFTGRSARALRDRFVDEHSSSAPRAYPAVHHLTGPLRAAARARHDPEGAGMWAGEGYRLAREVPAADVVRQLCGCGADEQE